MALRYQRRIGGSKGFGLNVSNSGISPSYRTKYSTIGSGGFSIRTGIPGLSLRSSYGRGKGKGDTAFIFAVLVALGFVLYYSVVIAYNLVRFTIWILTFVIAKSINLYTEWKQRKQQTNII